ncbi:hypothetical protein ACRAWD_31420 [Caulobacter segnis]
MASAVDIGSPYDIHPADKARVGQRLALLARKMRLWRKRPARRWSGPAGGAVARARTWWSPWTSRSGGLWRGAAESASRPATQAGAGTSSTPVWEGAMATGLAGAETRGGQGPRYAWADSRSINLYGVTGLPATPFGLAVP